MAGRVKIKDIGDNKNINIPIGDAMRVFKLLGINPKSQYLMDVKREIFKRYQIPDPVITVSSPRKTLSEQRPNNAYSIKITDKELKEFMEFLVFPKRIGFRKISEVGL